MMHALMRVPPVNLAPLEKLIPQTPGLRLVLLNALQTASRTDQLFRMINAGEVYVEIAVLETIAARARHLEVFGVSLITNVVAAPDTSHEEVTDVAKIAAPRLAALLDGIVERL